MAQGLVPCDSSHFSDNEVFSYPPPRWLVVLVAGMLLGSNAMAQTTLMQNPYWVKAATQYSTQRASSFGTTPAVSTYYVAPQYYDEGASNGIFNACGNPVFTTVGPRIYDQTNAEDGILPNFDGQLGGRSDNLELAIVPNDAKTMYYLFYSNFQSYSGGTAAQNTFYAATYTLSTDAITPLTLSTTPLFDVENMSGARMAVSRKLVPPNQFAGKRHLYVVACNNKVSRIGITTGLGTWQDVNRVARPAVAMGKEAELSHDGNKFMWAWRDRDFDPNNSAHHAHISIISNLNTLVYNSTDPSINWPKTDFTFGGLDVFWEEVHGI